MNGSCHFVYSLSVCSMVAVNLDRIHSVLPNLSFEPSTLTLIIMGGVVGGIIPDMDNPKSSIAKITRPLSGIICKVGKKFGRGGKYHRGILHDPILCIIGLIISYLFFTSLVGVFIGVLTHLYLDMFTSVGLPLFFGKKYIRFAELNTGGRNAVLFSYVNVVMAVIMGLGFYNGFFIPITAC